MTTAPDVVSFPDPNSNPTPHPSLQSSKIFLVVVANTTNDADTNTYDLQIKSKYSMIGNV